MFPLGVGATELPGKHLFDLCQLWVQVATCSEMLPILVLAFGTSVANGGGIQYHCRCNTTQYRILDKKQLDAIHLAINAQC